jgi:hypothetical protein
MEPRGKIWPCWHTFASLVLWFHSHGCPYPFPGPILVFHVHLFPINIFGFSLLAFSIFSPCTSSEILHVLHSTFLPLYLFHMFCPFPKCFQVGIIYWDLILSATSIFLTAYWTALLGWMKCLALQIHLISKTTHIILFPKLFAPFHIPHFKEKIPSFLSSVQKFLPLVLCPELTHESPNVQVLPNCITFYPSLTLALTNILTNGLAH